MDYIKSSIGLVLVLAAVFLVIRYVSPKNNNENVDIPLQEQESIPVSKTSSVDPKPSAPTPSSKDLKAANEKIKDILWDGVMRNMEYNFDFNNTYGPAITHGDCFMPNTGFSSPDVNKAIQSLLAIHKNNGSIAKVACWNDDEEGKWAMSISLLVPEDGYTFWCMDNNTSISFLKGIGTKKAVNGVSCQ